MNEPIIEQVIRGNGLISHLLIRIIPINHLPVEQAATCPIVLIQFNDHGFYQQSKDGTPAYDVTRLWRERHP